MGTGGTAPPTASGSGGAAAFTGAESAPPGRYVIDPNTPGENACAGTTLDTVLQALRRAYPELADITTIYNPARQIVGDGSFVYPYQKTGGGFAIAVKRGLGDCPAGCTENFYYYFETDASCTITQVGRYHASWGEGTCLNIDGAPRWGHPPPPDPSIICGADNRPQDLRGTYTFKATGQSSPCVLGAGNGTTSTVDVSLTMTVVQESLDFSTGMIAMTGTGHALIDGVGVPARFQRRRFEAEQLVSNLPSACPREHAVTVYYDFESNQPGSLMLTENGSETCLPCKGFMNLSLTRTP